MSEQGGGDLPEPKIEQLMAKLRMLQQEKRQLEEEVRDAQSVHDNLQKELAEYASSKLQLQCEDSEQDLNKQLKQNKTSEQLLERYRCEIEEVKLKHRKLRLRFENQLLQLIEQHKQLDYAFNPKRLPDELKKAEDIKRQLSSAEQVKLAQLHKLDEEVEEAKKQKQFETEDAQILESSHFNADDEWSTKDGSKTDEHVLNVTALRGSHPIPF
ncbi:PREDICTED: synaptonemal complex central element protein 1-like isoform X2 [Poecilia mexicana]|uniref:synaptonemal complex central element protein 1-like isoform X2 n=1 Tax=Poecilia mexicana TaxID=48701 RepID=UPI00072EA699|nr:PREDICTED: synaptonemal complex central element protein 1-like isoform X2 [Poecilia mexicana]